MTSIHEQLGEVGLPGPIAALAARTWDVVVVGGGHNGLACAAYLARAGRSVLVLERRERLGGACTLEQPFADPGYVVSPCAYVVGLLDPLVIDELQLRRHGYKVFVAEPAIWAPFDDGTWYAQFADHARTVAGMRENGFSEADIEGQFAYEAFFDRLRKALREGAATPGSVTPRTRPSCGRCSATIPSSSPPCSRTRSPTCSTATSPTRGWSRRCTGRGSSAHGPDRASPGTASIKLMHFQGTLEGVPMAWGYVEGGMGRISFAIAEAAAGGRRRAGRRRAGRRGSNRAPASCWRAAT